MQAHRLELAIREFDAATGDADMRMDLSDGTENSRSWIDSYEQYPPFDPHRPLRTPTYALWMQVSSEKDFLLLSIRNVLRAYDRLPENARPTMKGQHALKLMRDMAEHFDDVDGRSFRAFATAHHQMDADTWAATNKEIWLGGASGVPLSRIRHWLVLMRQALENALTAAGIAHPADLEASTVEGDDALAWPPERLRFHWSLPVVDEEDWPREDAPDELMELIATRFARLRQRDEPGSIR